MGVQGEGVFVEVWPLWESFSAELGVGRCVIVEVSRRHGKKCWKDKSAMSKGTDEKE